MTKDFLVSRADLRDTQLVESDSLLAEPGEAVLRVERFALTANNITYGVAGDLIGYWQFFPAPEGWGRIPVWGTATVTSSVTDHINEGDRFYGYFPKSNELKVAPDKVSPRGFVDSVTHRSALPPAYNQYSRLSADNGFMPGFDNHQILYRPLFMTSFLLDDYFRDNNLFGAEQIILGSASSKTAFGMAFMLKQSPQVKVIGLTSPGNVGFVEELGLYDEILTYDQVESVSQVPSAYVDMAGNRDVLSRLHHHLQDNMVNSCGVGVTHWEAREGEAPDTLPGAKPDRFFAPSQIIKRNKEVGPVVFQAKIAEATQAFYNQVDSWVNIEENSFSDVQQVYNTVLNGPAPDKGYVLTLD